MRKSVFTMCFLLAAGVPAAWAAEEASGSTVKKGVSSIVSGAVSAGKNAITGVVEGVETGRKEGESVDGARIAAGREDFQKLLSVSVVKAEPLDGQKVQITLAVRNDNDFPVRMTKLIEPKHVVLLDSDGFSYALPDPLVQGVDVTALPKSLTRIRYVFNNVEAAPAAFRLFEIDVAIPQQNSSASSASSL